MSRWMIKAQPMSMLGLGAIGVPVYTLHWFRWTALLAAVSYNQFIVHALGIYYRIEGPTKVKL